MAPVLPVGEALIRITTFLMRVGFEQVEGRQVPAPWVLKIELRQSMITSIVDDSSSAIRDTLITSRKEQVRKRLTGVHERKGHASTRAPVT